MDGSQIKKRKYFNSIYTITICFFLLCEIFSSAFASAIISSGDAAVTGFSGTVNQNNELMIDVDGPSVRIIQLPTSGPFGLREATKIFTVKAHDVGQVFGVALNDKSHPDIFVAATSAYGLGIFQPQGGLIKKGTAGAQWIVGQFGAVDSNGGPNSIWRIDGSTGKITLFANVSYNGLPGSPAALGGLAFDAVSQQLFVVDRGTGMIHRFSMDGVDHGIFDHGQEGLKAAGQSPISFSPKTLADITNSAFDSTDPNTWGYAPIERRVFAVAVHHNRLYYSVYGSHIWSVGIAADGGFASDPRLEVDVTPIASDSEISSIAFDDQGYMYIAERGFPTGDYNFMNVANAGKNRVMRFKPKSPTDSSPTFWETPGEEYAIGMPPEYQNANGGVDLNCAQTVWSTGERLIDPGIDGLQGNDKKLVKPENVPPTKSWFINYYDTPADGASRGHMGAIAILRICEKPATPLSPPPLTKVVPPNVKCSGGTYWVENCCVPPPTCPPDTYFENGYCIYKDCPWGYVRINGECVPPPLYCPIGTVYIDGYCVPFECPPPLILNSYGYCRCPYGSYYDNGRCLPIPPCPRGEIYIFGFCIPNWCPFDEVYINGRCVRRDCAYGEEYVNGRCIKRVCATGEEMLKGVCVKKSTKPLQTCPTGQSWINGKCTSKPAINIVCPRDQVNKNGKCVLKTPIQVIPKKPIPPKIVCSSGQVYKNGRCEPITISCPSGYVKRQGHCVPITISCPSGYAKRDGRCVPIVISCPSGYTRRHGHCVPITILCPRGYVKRYGRCVPIIISCPPGYVRRYGHCVPIYKPPIYRTPPVYKQPYTPHTPSNTPHVNIYYPPRH